MWLTNPSTRNSISPCAVGGRCLGPGNNSSTDQQTCREPNQQFQFQFCRYLLLNWYLYFITRVYNIWSINEKGLNNAKWNNTVQKWSGYWVRTWVGSAITFLQTPSRTVFMRRSPRPTSNSYNFYPAGSHILSANPIPLPGSTIVHFSSPFNLKKDRMQYH